LELVTAPFARRLEPTAPALILSLVTAAEWSFVAVTAPFLICDVPICETANAVPPSATNSAVSEIASDALELLSLRIYHPFRL
jgi:hypothetical protein